MEGHLQIERLGAKNGQRTEAELLSEAPYVV
jgi:hypothetical protein